MYVRVCSAMGKKTLQNGFAKPSGCKSFHWKTLNFRLYHIWWHVHKFSTFDLGLNFYTADLRSYCKQRHLQWEVSVAVTHGLCIFGLYGAIQILLLLPRCMQCRRSLAMRILSVCLSVCPSVCPSHACIVTKR